MIKEDTKSNEDNQEQDVLPVTQITDYRFGALTTAPPRPSSLGGPSKDCKKYNINVSQFLISKRIHVKF